MTARELLLERAQSWTDAEATAALRVVEAHTELATYFEAEADLPQAELDTREDAWARANAREAVDHEQW